MKSDTRRWLFGLESVAMVLLAVAACMLVIDLADRSYARFDLTLDGRNTLAPEVAERIAKLPEKVVIDVFFRPLRGVYDEPVANARGRMLELLYQAQNARRDLVEIQVHDLSQLAEVRARQQDLGVEGTQLVVFSSGARRAAFNLFDEIADIDWGNPTQQGLEYLMQEGLADAIDPRTWNPDPRSLRPPFLARFRGEEVLATGIAKVSQGTPPRVAFLMGHAEPSLDSNDDLGLSRLRRALETDGFLVAGWDAAASSAVPDGTDVLAVIGSEQSIEAEVQTAIHEWVEQGGHLFIAPSVKEVLGDLRDSVGALAYRYGMQLERGVVCQAFKDRLGRAIDSDERCAALTIGERGLSASHQITEPIRMHGARMQLNLAPSFRPGQHPGGMQPLTIVSSPKESWLDQPDAQGRLNFRRDPQEQRQRRALAMVAEYGVSKGAEAGEVQRSMVVGVSSSLVAVNRAFDANRDFLMNTFNHLAERDFRIGVTPRERRLSTIDLKQNDGLSRLSRLLGFGFPLCFCLIGCFVAWRRRS